MTPFRARGAGAVAEAWNASAGLKYRIDAALVAQNLLDHPLLHEEASLWEGDAFIAVKRSAAGLYEGPDPKVAHLSLLGEGASLSGLIERVSGLLASEGYEALVIGQDSGHFVPGAPTDIPWLGLFAKANGFEAGGLAFDLERDLEALPEGRVETSYEPRTVAATDVEALDAFLAKEFPGRWRYDVMGQVRAEGPGTVFGLFLEGRCFGFALLQTQGAKKPVGGANWRLDLGERWGSLGPIGISSDLRGAGLGRAFLKEALIELRSRGARRTIIDWTSLVDFYGTQGFSVNRTYRSYRRSLTAGRPPSA